MSFPMGEIQLVSLQETQSFGLHLGQLAQPGDIITLDGDLGAGKTTLTQFIGRGLDVPASCYITSPTFSLLHEYPGRIPVFHFDMYRLEEEEIADLGFEDYLYGIGVSIIEWSEKLGSLMPTDRLQIELGFLGESSRIATIGGHGAAVSKAEQLL